MDNVSTKWILSTISVLFLPELLFKGALSCFLISLACIDGWSWCRPSDSVSLPWKSLLLSALVTFSYSTEDFSGRVLASIVPLSFIRGVRLPKYIGSTHEALFVSVENPKCWWPACVTATHCGSKKAVSYSRSSAQKDFGRLHSRLLVTR